MKELGLTELIPAMSQFDYTMSEAGGVTNFVREYTLASGGSYCDCERAYSTPRYNTASPAPA